MDSFSFNSMNSDNRSIGTFTSPPVNAASGSISKQIPGEKNASIESALVGFYGINSQNASIPSFNNSAQHIASDSGNYRISTDPRSQDGSQVTNNADNELLEAWYTYVSGEKKNDYEEEFAKVERLLNDVIMEYIKRDKAEAKVKLEESEAAIGNFISVIGPKTHIVLIRLINLLFLLDNENTEARKRIDILSGKIDKTFKQFPESSQGEENIMYYRFFWAIRAYHLEISTLERTSILQNIWQVNTVKNYYLDLYYSIRGKLFEKVGKNREALEAYSKAFAVRHIEGQSHLLSLSCANIARVYINKKDTGRREQWEKRANDFNKKHNEVDIRKHDELLMTDPFYKTLLSEYIATKQN